MITDNLTDLPNRWMLLSAWTERTGYTKHAFHGKKNAGIWVEGQHWIKSPDGKIQIDWRAIEDWIESNYENDDIGQAGREGNQEH